MSLPPETSQACRSALEKVAKTAKAAEASRDARSALHALNAVYFAIEEAQRLLLAADADARLNARLKQWDHAMGIAQ